MPKLQSGPLVAVLLVLALVAAACGGSNTDVVDTAAGQATAEDADSGQGAAQDTDSGQSDDADPADTDSDGGDSTGESDTDEAAEAPASEPIAHQFPELTTVNIADGSTVNLADQLAGGDTPVLLWFFAPH
jgi:hypothetical protein